MFTLRSAVHHQGQLKSGIEVFVLPAAARHVRSKRTIKKIGPNKTSGEKLLDRSIPSTSDAAQSKAEGKVDQRSPVTKSDGLESILSYLDPANRTRLDDLKRQLALNNHRLEFLESVDEWGRRAIVGRVYCDPSKDEEIKNDSATSSTAVAVRGEFSYSLLDKMSHVVRTKPDLTLSREGGWGGIWFTEKEMEHLKELDIYNENEGRKQK